jgi:hypothetical protein
MIFITMDLFIELLKVTPLFGPQKLKNLPDEAF